MKTSFYVYENHPNNKTKIHLGNRGDCNYGKGQIRFAGKNKGKWHGPFYSLEDAKSFAITLGKKNNSLCKNCFRNIKP